MNPDAERPFVRQFDYADLPGYAVVTVNAAKVSARIYSGVGREVWRTVELTKLLEAQQEKEFADPSHPELTATGVMVGCARAPK